MERINVGIIGTGWCGGIRAETAADSPFVNELHIAESRPERKLRPSSRRSGAGSCRA